MDNLGDWKKAGRLAGEAREYGATLVKEGASLLDIALKIESHIEKKGGIPGFPVQISLNNIAAHYTPFPDDTAVFKAGDLVKLDLGVHINGCVGDTAVTIEVSTKKYGDLMKASKEALENAIKILKPGIQVWEIGKVVEETIQKYKFEPIRNLCGHRIEQFVLHAGPSIPNYNNNNHAVLEEGFVVAIEPFASTGVGLVKEGKQSSNFRLVNTNPIRDAFARKIMDHVKERYYTLPFSYRALTQVFDKQKVAMALRLLEKNGNIEGYAQLPEKSDGMVAQYEHTILIQDKPVILTQVDD